MALKRNRTRWGDALSRTRWDQFEHILAEHYRSLGFAVEHCGTASGGNRYDGGVDLVLRRDGETTLVQCKHWNVAQVPHNDVHQLLGLVETRNAQRAILVTSGEFTGAAREAAARSRRIELVDGAKLRRMIDPRLIPEVQESAPPWSNIAADGGHERTEGRRSGRRRRRRNPQERKQEAVFGMVMAAVLVFGGFLFLRQQLDKVEASLSRPARVHVPNARDAAAARPAPDRALAQRLRRVQVYGGSLSEGRPVVIVELAGLEPDQAHAEICRQSEPWLRHSMSGQTLRVLRYRGKQPALHAGIIRC